VWNLNAIRRERKETTVGRESSARAKGVELEDRSRLEAGSRDLEVIANH